MAPTFGKRKRSGREATHDATSPSENSSEGQNEDVQDVFRRHFESHFKPLAKARKATKIVDQEITNEDDEESEWEGLSEPEEGAQIEVIEHKAAQALSTMSKEELRLFMSAKPPIGATLASPASKLSASLAKDDLDETANLKKDLALQRLLAESHLFDTSSITGISGVNRHKATDLRLQSLGAKTSILAQEKMPMSHRKGIVSKKSEREEKRRKESRENGIILEKVKRGTNSPKETRRDRGIGGPGVGRFSRGTLRLSKKDLFDIEGPKQKFPSKGGKIRGRGSGALRGTR